LPCPEKKAAEPRGRAVPGVPWHIKGHGVVVIGITYHALPEHANRDDMIKKIINIYI
jgi:hypothetical protein